MKKLRLKAKLGKPFISKFGSEHPEAVMVVSNVNNSIIDKKLDIGFSIYNSENDLDKQFIHYGFILSFTEKDKEENIMNPTTGEVIKWGKPSYTEVLQYFDIVDDGIVLNSAQVEMWFLNKVTFLNEPIINNWAIV